MNITIYSIKSPVFKGKIYLGFQGGELTRVEYPKDFPVVSWDQLHQYWPRTIAELKGTSETLAPAYTFEELKERSCQDKTIAFCMYFKQYRGISYVAKDREIRNLKDVPVNRELLQVFFETPLQNYTIDNYISRINITKDHLRNGATAVQSRFPSSYSPDFEKKLDAKTMQAYHQHLAGLGFEKRYNPNRGVYWEERQKTGGGRQETEDGS